MSKVVSVSPSRDIAFKQADSLRKHLKKRGVELSKSESLEAVAALFDYKNWDTYSSFLVKKDKEAMAPHVEAQKSLDAKVAATGVEVIARQYTILPIEESARILSSARQGDPLDVKTPIMSIARSDYQEMTMSGNQDIDYIDQIIDMRIEGPFYMVLDYPFDLPMAIRIEDAAELTYRELIDLLRAGYRSMYGDTTARALPMLLNTSVTSETYGSAFHSIGDLVLERINLDLKNRIFSFFIGS